eukprot:m.19695 g.19695  ORF g.19695 m.19695 type:complete len:202 (+) comp27879_c0_seq3:23-628(+)
MALQRAVKLFEEIKGEWGKKPDTGAMERCGFLLSDLKICLTSVSFLPAGSTKASMQELVIARDALEIGAFLAIHNKDIPSFQRYMAQLKCYYTDYGDNTGKSAFEQELLGLNLLCLLAQNRLSEYHTELELLDPKALQDNVYLRYPISLERVECLFILPLFVYSSVSFSISRRVVITRYFCLVQTSPPRCIYFLLISWLTQ